MELNTSRLAEICSTLFEVATEGILIVTRSGEIVLQNPAASEIFGYSKQEFEGMKVEDLIPRDKRGGHKEHRKGYNSNPKKRRMGLGMDLFGLTKSGKQKPVEISLSQFEFDEEPYVMALITDISERKLSQDAILQAKSELEQKVKERTKELEANIERQKQAELEIQKAYEQEKELSELKSRFVSMASHEFKTPLANILTSATLINKYQKEEQNDKREKHVNKIKRSVNTLNAILNDFLSLDRVESGKMSANSEKFDFIKLCNESIDQLNLLLKENQRIELQTYEQAIEVELDKNAIKHIVANLLSNAVKYSSENSTIILEVVKNDSSLQFSVSDSGMGIPEEEQKNIFGKFFRAKNSLNIQGTGLGLHIIKHYIDLMNGAITFKSKEGVGTTFYILIPY